MISKIFFRERRPLSVKAFVVSNVSSFERSSVSTGLRDVFGLKVIGIVLEKGKDNAGRTSYGSLDRCSDPLSFRDVNDGVIHVSLCCEGQWIVSVTAAVSMNGFLLDVSSCSSGLMLFLVLHLHFFRIRVCSLFVFCLQHIRFFVSSSFLSACFCLSQTLVSSIRVNP